MPIICVKNALIEDKETSPIYIVFSSRSDLKNVLSIDHGSFVAAIMTTKNSGPEFSFHIAISSKQPANVAHNDEPTEYPSYPLLDVKIA